MHELKFALLEGWKSLQHREPQPRVDYRGHFLLFGKTRMTEESSTKFNGSRFPITLIQIA